MGRITSVLGHSMKYVIMLAVIIIAGCSSPRTSIVTGRMANPSLIGDKEFVNFNSIIYSNGSAQGGGMYERNVYKFAIIPIRKSDDGKYELWNKRSRWVGDPFSGGEHFKDEIVGEWIPCGDKFAIEIPIPNSGNVILLFKSISEPGKFGYISADNADRVTCDELLIDKMYQPDKMALQLVDKLPIKK
jgi:hypothetical protein